MRVLKTRVRNPATL